MGKAALALDANTFAFFTRNPRGGKAKEIDEKDVEKFLNFAKEHEFGKIVAHAPYTMNLLFFLRNLLIRLRCDHGSTGTYCCTDPGIISVPAERDYRWRGSRSGEIIKEYYSCEVAAVKWW